MHNVFASPLLAGGGAMGELLRNKDWSDSKLGPPATWPQSLRTALSIALSSRFPMILFWGEDLCVLYNDAYTPIFGTKHPEILGKTGLEAWGEVWDVIFPMFQKVRRGEATWSEDQFLALHRHGFTEETYHTWSYSPIVDEAGNVGGVFTAVQETTARVLGERRLALLRELGEQLAGAKTIEKACAVSIETLSENAYDVPFAAIYLAEGDDLERFRRAGAVGVDEERMPPLVHGEGLWSIAEVARSGSPAAIECADVVSTNGPWPEPSRHAYVLPIAKPGLRRPYGVLVAGLSPRLSFDDAYASFFQLAAHQIASLISNAVAYEEERRRVEALAELDRAKTTFFSNVSHEFRTPLTLMLGPIDDMRAQMALSAVDRERLDLLQRNASRLLKLVNTLLDFSRIEAGRVEAVYVPTDLSALTADLVSSFRSAIERAGLSLVVDCPPLAEPLLVDRDMWEKIVLNLVSNAFKFTFEGSITVRLHAETDHAVLEVSDTGAGIAENELPRIFERFHRIEGARSRSHEGSGIGLALVNELVRLHGGRIEVTSRPGRGTGFFVRIPRGSAHLPEERVRATRTLPSTAVDRSAYVEEALRWISPSDTGSPARITDEGGTLPFGGRARILFADDNADMRDYMARLLRERWDAETVSDGQAALESIRRNPPDLVISDVMMPRLDGFGLLRALRSDASTSSIPFVLLSARAGEEATAEGLKAGADDYVVKPFTARDLLVRVAARLTASKAMAAAEEQRANLYRGLMQTPFPIAILRGPAHVIDAINAAALEVWNRGPDIIGKPVLAALPELRDQPFPALLDKVYRTGKPHVGREECVSIPRGPGGSVEEVFFTYVYAPLVDSAGAAEGIMVCAFEVTGEVRARHAVEAANRAKDEFLATMSHELRTPLNSVLGWAAMLRSNPKDPKKLARGLEVIERNARAQERIVSDLLDMSRIISGKLQLSMSIVEVWDVVHAAGDVVRPAAEGKGVQLIVDVGPDLGAVVGDPARLQQVLWNVLSNAVRFTPRGGRVTVTGERSTSEVTLCVRDTGAGIPAEHLPHVFERFRQVDSSTTRAHGGLGLGLAIVRHLVEAHGGAVEAHSEGAGRGAVFSIVLPIRAVSTPVAETRADALPEATSAHAAPTKLARVRVLLVEDDPDSLDLVRGVLEGAGARVTGASSAREALRARGPFDVIVSDIGMPDMDGYALIRRVRQVDAKVPALALTAYARPDDAARAKRAGYQEHLAKPIDASRLLDAVDRWSRTRRKSRRSRDASRTAP